MARTGLDPALVEDVIWGCVSQTGEQAVNVGRNAALAAGWPEDVVGVTLDRQCGSSQQAVHFAAAGVIAGQYDVAVAGGVESMSRVPMLCTVTQGPGVPFGPRMLARYDDVGGLVPQGVSAEIIAERWKLSRTELDEIAVRSHANAAAASRRRVPSTASWRRWATVGADEGIRRGQLARDAGRAAHGLPGGRRGDRRQLLADLRRRRGAAGDHLGGGRAARLAPAGPAARVRHRRCRPGDHADRADPGDRAGPRAGRAHRWPTSTRSRSTRRSPRSIGAWLAETGADPARVNPRGGAIALGHPLGGSGARLMTTLVHHLQQTGGRWGLQTMCEGGGMANATVLERL